MKPRIFPVWIYVALAALGQLELAARYQNAGRPWWSVGIAVLVGILALLDLIMWLSRTKDER